MNDHLVVCILLFNNLIFPFGVEKLDGNIIFFNDARTSVWNFYINLNVKNDLIKYTHALKYE